MTAASASEAPRLPSFYGFRHLPEFWQVMNIEQTVGTYIRIVGILFEVQAVESDVYRATGKVGGPRHNCLSGIGHEENAGAVCLGA
jgi:hypothetical protein